jgi:hypothetical protein
MPGDHPAPADVSRHSDKHARRTHVVSHRQQAFHQHIAVQQRKRLPEPQRNSCSHGLQLLQRGEHLGMCQLVIAILLQVAWLSWSVRVGVNC